jgi:hypothetical protein
MGGLFGGAKPPKPQPPVRLPDEDDPAIAEEARRKRMAATSKSGRASTVLTDGGSGNGAYANTVLGQ